MNATIEVYRRTDGKWAWRLVASNGNIIATDGGQGYENRADCEDMALDIVAAGKYRHSDIAIDPVRVSRGGVVKGPQIAIVGENGDERVTPL